MSADDGIYIAHFPHGYRVAHAQAIDNIDFAKEHDGETVRNCGLITLAKTLCDYFGESKVCYTRREADEEAEKLEKIEGDFGTEYGICDLGDLPEFLTEEEAQEVKKNAPLPVVPWSYNTHDIITRIPEAVGKVWEEGYGVKLTPFISVKATSNFDGSHMGDGYPSKIYLANSDAGYCLIQQKS